MSGQSSAVQKRTFGLEGTYGTAVVPSKWMGLVVDAPDNSERRVEENRSAGGMEAGVLIPVEFTFKGSVDTIPQDGSLLRYAWNSLATGSSAGSYVHSLDWNDGSGNLPSMTYEIATLGSPVTVRRFSGLKFNRETFSNDEKDMLHIQSDWIAQSVVASGNTQASVSASSTLPYLFNNGTTSIGGSVLSTITNATVNVNTTLEEKYYVKSGTAPTVTELPESLRSYDGTISVDFENLDMYQRFLASQGNTAGVPLQTGSEFNAQVSWVKSATDKIVLTLSGCMFKGTPTEGGTDGLIKQTLNFTARDVNGQVVSTGSPL